MTLPLIVIPVAQAEVSRAFRWYTRRRLELGVEFLESLEQTFAKVRQSPEFFPKEHRDLRLAVFDRFPYYVVYRLSAVQITVVAVYHKRRDPRRWKRR